MSDHSLQIVAEALRVRQGLSYDEATDHAERVLHRAGHS